MTFRILAIGLRPGRSYKTMERLPDADFGQACRALIAQSRKRLAPVVLRDGTTGRRFSVGDAMDHHGLTFVERWHPERWLARNGGKA